MKPRNQSTDKQAVETVLSSLGLLEGHISPQQSRATVRVPAGGYCVQVNIPNHRPPPRSAIRGRIHGFSRRSRRRLQQSFGEIDYRFLRTLPLFLTLTYPLSGDPGPDRYKRDLDAFLKRLRRHRPLGYGVWRLELTENGVGHFHIMLFNVRYVDTAWLSRAWYKVADTGVEAHERAGTQVKRCRSLKEVAGYVSKYVGKLDPDASEVPDLGRMWAWFATKHKETDVEVITCRMDQAFRMRRLLYRLARGRGWRTIERNTRHGMLLFCEPDTTERLGDYIRGEPPSMTFETWNQVYAQHEIRKLAA